MHKVKTVPEWTFSYVHLSLTQSFCSAYSHFHEIPDLSVNVRITAHGGSLLERLPKNLNQNARSQLAFAPGAVRYMRHGQLAVDWAVSLPVCKVTKSNSRKTVFFHRKKIVVELRKDFDSIIFSKYGSSDYFGFGRRGISSSYETNLIKNFEVFIIKKLISFLFIQSVARSVRFLNTCVFLGEISVVLYFVFSVILFLCLNVLTL